MGKHGGKRKKKVGRKERQRKAMELLQVPKEPAPVEEGRLQYGWTLAMQRLSAAGPLPVSAAAGASGLAADPHQVERQVWALLLPPGVSLAQLDGAVLDMPAEPPLARQTQAPPDRDDPEFSALAFRRAKVHTRPVGHLALRAAGSAAPDAGTGAGTAALRSLFQQDEALTAALYAALPSASGGAAELGMARLARFVHVAEDAASLGPALAGGVVGQASCLPRRLRLWDGLLAPRKLRRRIAGWRVVGASRGAAAADSSDEASSGSARSSRSRSRSPSRSRSASASASASSSSSESESEAEYAEVVFFDKAKEVAQAQAQAALIRRYRRGDVAAGRGRPISARSSDGGQSGSESDGSARSWGSGMSDLVSEDGPDWEARSWRTSSAAAAAAAAAAAEAAEGEEAPRVPRGAQAQLLSLALALWPDFGARLNVEQFVRGLPLRAQVASRALDFGDGLRRLQDALALHAALDAQVEALREEKAAAAAAAGPQPPADPRALPPAVAAGGVVWIDNTDPARGLPPRPPFGARPGRHGPAPSPPPGSEDGSVEGALDALLALGQPPALAQRLALPAHVEALLAALAAALPGKAALLRNCALKSFAPWQALHDQVDWPRAGPEAAALIRPFLPGTPEHAEALAAYYGSPRAALIGAQGDPEQLGQCTRLLLPHEAPVTRPHFTTTEQEAIVYQAVDTPPVLEPPLACEPEQDADWAERLLRKGAGRLQRLVDQAELRARGFTWDEDDEQRDP